MLTFTTWLKQQAKRDDPVGDLPAMLAAIHTGHIEVG